MNTELFSYPGEQCVEAVDFLPLRDVGVVLSNALQSEFLHQVYLIWFLKVLGLQQGHRINRLECAFKNSGSKFTARI